MSERKKFNFYFSFYEAVKDLPRLDRLEIFRAIVNYGLNRKEPADFTNPDLRKIWEPIKLRLETDWKRHDKMLGNRNASKRNAEASSRNTNNTSVSSRNTKDTVNVNVNVNDNKENIEKKDNLSLSVSVPADTPYLKYLAWRKKECPHLSKMEEMTEKQLMRVIDIYGKKAVFETLLQMDNWRNVTKYRSIYFTLRNWLNRQDDNY